MTPPAGKSSFQLILDTAEALIQQKGCRQTTLQDIIRESGLSKGAIYHYVSSKDELLGLVMKSRIEQVHRRFTEAVSSPQTQGIRNPLQMIAEGMMKNTSHEDVTNQIFLYLLTQMDNPTVAATMREVYDYMVQTSVKWIEVGQHHGVIPADLDKHRVADMLVTFMYGIRVKNTVRQDSSGMKLEEIIGFMAKALQ
ncbi:TetR/AcrR family transcriptional regulator [Cohnella caldifontis]|uniref:TetR/AcrR family transcriptional regulator n=1 Tax=Cohnella caldifontis TaxID=3027471 RepID=UPI0023EDF83F|nr:TetR/AcrR family transcriptional regulator [Cohnella sp. YIM B05605]